MSCAAGLLRGQPGSIIVPTPVKPLQPSPSWPGKLEGAPKLLSRKVLLLSMMQSGMLLEFALLFWLGIL